MEDFEKGAAIAAAMGPNEDMLVPVGKPADLMLCDKCAMATSVAELWGKAAP